MIGDPKVLGPLQQAFNASDDPNVQGKLAAAWTLETGHDAPYTIILNEIRAWTPPDAEPSLDDLAFGLSIKFAEISVELDELKSSLERLKNQQTLDCKHTGIALTDFDRRLTVQENMKPEQHPEPTAPDDPVCVNCGHDKGDHRSRGCDINMSDGRTPCGCTAFLPAPQPAPDLDPVLRDGRDKAIKQQAIVTVLQRYHSISSFFDKSSLNRMAIEMLQEMDKDGGA